MINKQSVLEAIYEQIRLDNTKFGEYLLSEQPRLIPQLKTREELKNYNKRQGLLQQIKKENNKIYEYEDDYKIQIYTYCGHLYGIIDEDDIGVEFAPTTDKKTKGVVIANVQQIKHYLGTARSVIFNFFLKFFTYVECDEEHMPLGQDYWIKIIQQGLEEGYKCTVINKNTNQESPITVQAINKYYNNEGNFRFRIYKKK